MRIAVLSDTHVRDGSTLRLPAPAVEQLERAEVIVHAGDVVGEELLGTLRVYAPVHAVLGNNDVGLALPETIERTIDGVRIAVIHDSGPRTGREGRVHRRFPNADIVVFGHSHIPWNAEGIGGQWLLNPGSPTERRMQPHRTMAVIDTSDGGFTTEVLIVDERR